MKGRKPTIWRLAIPSLGLLAGLLIATPSAADEWVEVVRKGPCVVQAIQSEGSVASVMATCDWDLPFPQALATARGVERAHEFLSILEVSERLPDGRVLQVNRRKGLARRQSTIDLYETRLPGGGMRISWSLSSHQEPLREGVVAAAVNEGFWEVTPLSTGGATVTYQLRFDPGGKLRVHPRWVRYFQRVSILKMLREFRREIERRVKE